MLKISCILKNKWVLKLKENCTNTNYVNIVEQNNTCRIPVIEFAVHV